MDIRKIGDPVLRRPARPVEAINNDIRKICEQMVEAMLRADGVGLAAPQIGIDLQIFVIDVEGQFHVLINPELVETSEESEETTEGCLSVPGVSAPVTRSQRATVRGTTLEGETVEIEGEGYLARAIQHEMDHLNGNLFVDRLSPARRRSILKEYERKQHEEPS